MKKVLLILLLIVSTFGLTGCVSSDVYSEEKHMERIAKRVEKYFIIDDYEYTSFEMYKLYDENDEFKYILVEFEPYGFLFVQIREKSMPIIGSHMYSVYLDKSWCRYYYEGIDEETELPIIVYEKDENGEIIRYNCSPFKEANVLNEKKYALRVKVDGASSYILAVKRGDKYLNLVSMQLFEYKSSYIDEKPATYYFFFVPTIGF